MMSIMCLNRMKGSLATATCGSLPEKVRFNGLPCILTAAVMVSAEK